MKPKKKQIIIFFEFFESQDMEKLEHDIRALQKRGLFPKSSKMIPMIHYKNLRVIGIKEKGYPMVMNKNDITENKGT